VGPIANETKCGAHEGLGRAMLGRDKERVVNSIPAVQLALFPLFFLFHFSYSNFNFQIQTNLNPYFRLHIFFFFMFSSFFFINLNLVSKFQT
jgi:hypothetical protein